MHIFVRFGKGDVDESEKQGYAWKCMYTLPYLPESESGPVASRPPALPEYPVAPYLINGLYAGCTYDFRLAVVLSNGAVTVGPLFSYLMEGPPGRCNRVALAAKPKATSFTLLWDPPKTGSKPFLDYCVTIWHIDPTTNHPGTFRQIRTPNTKLKVDQLYPGQRFVVRLSATNMFGEGPPSVPDLVVSTAAAVPSRPAPPHLASQSAKELVVEWTAPEGNGSSVLEYRLEMDRGDSSDLWPAYSGPDLTHTVRNIQPGMAYRARVRAVNAVGPSEYSQMATLVTAAGAPEAMAAPFIDGAPSRSSVMIRWVPPDSSSPILCYQLKIKLLDASPPQAADGWSMARQSDSWEEAYVGNATYFLLGNLNPGQRYLASVSAISDVGTSPPSRVTEFVTASSPPPPCPAPKAGPTPHGDRAFLSIAWDSPERNNGSKITLYRVLARPAVEAASSAPPASGRDGWQPVYEGPLCEALLFDDIEPGAMYEVCVQAVNRLGGGPFGLVSVLAAGTTRPGPVGGLRLLKSTLSTLSLRWETPHNGGTPIVGYQ